MNTLDLDSGLGAVLDFVREVHNPISQAITDRKGVTATDCAMLSGAVEALLNAIDARLPQPEARPVVEAVAA
ncbi:hypothetical protein AB0D78_28530 [Streptomyces avermitilis]|uniref:hypothetical protein n=1 Tax=Streptomyces avermitilis TaxID=33903 RepID=UPI0033F67B26